MSIARRSRSFGRDSLVRKRTPTIEDIHGNAIVQLPSGDIAAGGASQAVDILQDGRVDVVLLQQLDVLIDRIAADLHG